MPRSSPAVAGRHVCGVAPTVEAHGRMAAHWIRDGLEADLRVIWIERPGGSTRQWLDLEQVAWEPAMASGQLEIAPPGGVLHLSSRAEIPGRLGMARELVEQALEQGYSGLSVGTEVRDALSVMSSVEDQLAFEAAWEQFTREHPLWLLCLYGPTATPPHLEGALPLHPRELHHPLVSARASAGGISVSGEIDLLNAHLMRGFLHAAVGDRDQEGDMELDLSGVSFIDLQGVRDLLEVARANGGRGRLRLLDPPRSLRRVLDVAGWAQDLDVVEATA